MPVKGVPDKQYLIREPRSRLFIDSILVSVKGIGEKNEFSVRMKHSLRRNQDELFSRLFLAEESDTVETNLARRFLISSLRLQHSESISDSHEDNSDEDSGSGKWIVSHKLSDIDIRRTLIEFGRCFVSGSISGRALGSNESSNQALEFSNELAKFSSWSNDKPISYDECRKNLFVVGKKVENTLSSAGRVACAISSSIRCAQSAIFRNIAFVLCDIISNAINFRNRYLELFEANQNEDVRLYNSLHKDGTGLVDEQDRNWLSEAQRTGEFFPGRPQVRPAMVFGNYSRKENSRTCRKNYVKSDSHSPGIFTVQCVCRHPKLIGPSVMRECEGVSTALSVLLKRFKVLPRVCYYDNACNLSRSITLRCPWLYDEYTVVCDRFHYQGDTCNSVYDPSSYILCSNHTTSGAESMNH